MAHEDDEFAELDTTDAEFDAMAAAGVPVQVISFAMPGQEPFSFSLGSEASYSGGSMPSEFSQVSTDLPPQGDLVAAHS